MQHVNVEVKATCADPEAVRQVLRRHGADFRGTDRQVDTYFPVPAGRLKLREGNIENRLIYYERGDQPGPRRADVLLLDTAPGSPIKDILTRALGVRVVVDKRREIYFIDNVKFHIDVVEGLGSFVEIEAQSAPDETAPDLPERLGAQCRAWMDELALRPEDLLTPSYSDMLVQPRGQPE